MNKYKKYPKEFYDESSALLFVYRVSKYGYYNRVYKKRNRKYCIRFKKAKNCFKRNVNVWKKKNYSKHIKQYYTGIRNERDFPKRFDTIYDYSYEWNIFCVYNGSWYVRFTNYDMTFGEIKKFKHKKHMEQFVNSLLKRNRYGLWDMDEYEELLIYK